MTREAVMTCLVIPMALDAEPHFQFLIQNDPVHQGNIPVAFAAVNSPMDMDRMVEIIEIGQSINSLPDDRLPLKKMFPQFLDRRICHNDTMMAQHACLEGRNSRPGRTHSFRVTYKTAQLLLRNVNAMAEGDRLFRPDIGFVIKIESVQKKTDQENHPEADESLDVDIAP
jgi:hypothetical protein